MVGRGDLYAASHRDCFVIDYPVNVSDVRPDFSNNRQTIDSIALLLRQTDGNPFLNLTRIDISGSASPEGNPRANARLALKRMQNAGAYLKNRFGIGDSVINYTGSFVPWNGLLDAVGSRYPEKSAKLKEILTEGSDTSVADVTRRMNNLRRFEGGKIWLDMKRNVLPGLRRATVICVTTEENPAPEPAPEPEPEPEPEPAPVQEPEPGPEPEPVGPEVPDCHRAWHISTDLAGWASLVSNVSGEFDFACRWSLNLNLRYSAWNYGKTTQKFRTFEFRPQVRYWFAPGHNRWFVEAHLSMISYNVALPG